MKTILVPLDGSLIAKQALPYAQMLATILSARVHLVRVLSSADKDHILAGESAILAEAERTLATQRERTQYVWEVLRGYAERYLDVHATTLRHVGLDVEIDVRIGSPAETIVAIAEHQPIDLIVMATHGYSGLRRWALGSVTDKVIQATTTPVFIVRGTEQEPARDLTLKRIMVPLDGSALAQQALPCALELATCAHADLLLLRAVSPFIPEHYTFGPLGGPPMPYYIEETMAAIRDQAAQDLAAVAGKLRHYDVPITTHVAYGHPAEVIVDQAAEHNVDLIVMATHGYGGIQRWALGSVADKVLHATTTPLLLVHAVTTEE